VSFFIRILPKSLQNKDFKLLFRASRDGYQISTFHQKCDSKGANIVIIESTLGHVFGGYISLGWAGAGHINDPKAFMFLIRSSKGHSPTRYKIINAATAFYATPSYGPTYGSGYDFYVCDNCNTSNASYSNPTGSYNVPKDRGFLPGDYNFTVKDYECFQVI